MLLLSRRFLFFCWLLLVIPTVALGWFAWRALQAQEQMIREEARAGIARDVRLVKDDLSLFITRMRSEIMRTLRGMDQTELETQLIQLREQEPFVRNVFIRRADGTLLYPPDQSSVDAEARAFMERFKSLFAQDTYWPRQEDDRIDSAVSVVVEDQMLNLQQAVASEQVAPPPTSQQVMFRGRMQTEQEALAYNVRQSQAPRAATSLALADSAAKVGDKAEEVLAEGAVMSMPRPTTAPAEASDAAPMVMARELSRAEPVVARPVEEGWIGWFWGADFSFMGWIKRAPDDLIYGVEMEMDALYARLPLLLPEPVPGFPALALYDARGELFYASAGKIPADGDPDLVFDLNQDLPHWRLVAYLPVDKLGTSVSFEQLGRLIIAAVIFTIVGGGSLLLWQAERSRRDSLNKSTFVSSVSHELKTPLTTIRLYAEMLGEHRVKDEDKRRRYLETITAESQRLTRLVNNVLDFSRLDKGPPKRNPVRLDLVGWLRDQAEGVRLRLGEAGMTLALDFPDTPVMVEVDTDSFGQVFLNLVDNAIKYAASGKQLKIGLISDRSGVAIRFEDHGPGVPRKHRRRIFQPFHRVDTSLTAHQAGCGLGLSIASRLIHDEGGELTYDEAVSPGACFTVRLPLPSTGISKK